MDQSIKKNRKEFLKLSGLTGFGFVGTKLLSGCTYNPESENRPEKDWQSDPEWQEIKYGAWGGPGVDPRPGAMDEILLKDYAPKSSLVLPETFVPKAKYPVIDVHIHHYPDTTFIACHLSNQGHGFVGTV